MKLDDVGADAAQRIVESSTFGALFILTVVLAAITIGVIVKMWRADVAKLEARLIASEDAHQRTRDAHMADVRSLANVSEAIQEMRSDIVRVAMGRN